jgi:hypothetical protein
MVISAMVKVGISLPPTASKSANQRVFWRKNAKSKLPFAPSNLDMLIF